jgi:pentatricopeptide repeat protein
LLQQDLPFLIRSNAPEEQVTYAFEKLLEIGCATAYSYTITISYLAKRGRADLAWEYWTNLKEQQGIKNQKYKHNTRINIRADIRPNDRTYCAIISAVCRSGDLGKAEELLKEALERRNIKNRVQLYKTILMDYFYFNRGLDTASVAKAEKLFLESLSFETDEANKLEMFEVMAKLYAKNGLTKKITQLLTELTKRNIQPTVNFMNSLMEVYLHDDNMNDAMLVFSSFTNFKLPPNAITYSILLVKLLKHAKANNYAPDRENDEKIEAIFKVMRTTVKNTQHSKSAYTEMIQYYFMKDFPKKGNEVFDLMRNNGFADVIAYNVMIDYYREVDINYTFALFDEMLAKNISPNMITYLLLIDYYCKVNQIDEAFDLLAKAKSKNLHPNVATYTTLIDYLGKTNRYDRIEILLKEMIEVGVNPNEHTFAVLVNNLIRTKHFAKAYTFVKEMKKFGLRPTRVVYATLFDGILTNTEAASLHADSFIKLVKSHQQDFPLDDAVRYYAERRKNQRIIALWKMFDDYGLELSEETEEFLRGLLNKDESEREPKKEAEASTEQEEEKGYFRSVTVPNFR